MATIKVICPYCKCDKVICNGKTKKGLQRYLCKNESCPHKTFQIEYTYNACIPGTKEKVIDMAMNGSGVRDTGRVLGISKDTVTSVLKKKRESVEYVNYEYMEKYEGNEIDVDICSPLEAEMDEMWSFCHDKSHQIWLWWAVDHKTNTPIAFWFGTREHKNLDKLIELLNPYKIGKVYADNNFAYEKRFGSDILKTGKKNTQQIERDHLTLRTRIKRLARKTICFPKSEVIHTTVIGLFINRYWFSIKQ